MINLRKLIGLLSLLERKRAYLLLGMVIFMAVLDVFGVASIMPFIAVLANPDLIETNALLNSAYAKVGFTEPQQFLFALGVLVFAMLVTSLAFKALTTYALTRFALMREYSIGQRLVEGYLTQPYSWFLDRNSSDLGKNILSEVNVVIYNGMLPLTTLMAQGAVAVALLVLLIIVDPLLALSAGVVLSLAYVSLFVAMSGWLKRLGKARIQANQDRFAAVSEAFSAVKEVKIGGLEQAYINRFATPAEIYAKRQATAQVIIQLPRFALEAVAFGGLLLVILYLMARSGGFASALPTMALYAFAGYRLMPALQQIYGAISQIRFVGPALEALHADLMNLQSVNPSAKHDVIMLEDSIVLNQIDFSYPGAPQAILNNLCLTIPAKSTVGLVGSTGSGKTTTVDLILGLLEAQQGALEVDGHVITAHNRRSWQRAIGYVPQEIYLSDDTVAANIAFGLKGNDIDDAAVERAAKLANIHDFVVTELPQQYQTHVGERGVRLSGGQRQRIGIARALYHNPQVLVLDEATRALDSLTEQAVMEAIHRLGHEITIILIAHRLGTVKACDLIYLLHKGSLEAHGTFDELIQKNERFRKMAQTS